MATLLKPDPTFYPSAKMAMQAPAEEIAYVATLRTDGKPDGLATVDVKPGSATYGQIISQLEFPYVGDEIHHFGWNACSAALCPTAPHPFLERRYLLIPGLKSSRIYIVDTKDNPRAPKLIRTIEPEEVFEKTGYSRPHTIHCGPDGIYVSTLGSSDDNGDGPAGIFLLDHFNLNVLGKWEVDRGPQRLGYDFWWHLGHDVGITSEWGPPRLFENGVSLDDIVNRRFGHQVHIWDLRRRKHHQALDLGDQYQMVLELRPAHDPTKAYGFVGVVTDVTNLASSIWVWYKKDGNGNGKSGDWGIEKVIEIPAQAADPADLPPALQPLSAVPPLITDINLSLDDKFLYVSCWGTGELRQYDVSDPFKPVHTGTIRIGGIFSEPHSSGAEATGGPQMVEVSRDGKRVYFTNSLYSSWDDQFYPNGLRGWLAKADVDPNGGFALDPNFWTDFGNVRAHQVRLQGGDSSSDSFCFPS